MSGYIFDSVEAVLDGLKAGKCVVVEQNTDNHQTVFTDDVSDKQLEIHNDNNSHCSITTATNVLIGF